MATTTKKAAPKTRKTTAKPATKRAPAKSSASATKVRRVSKAAATPEMKSFRPARPQESFFTFRITHQTLYWLILAGIVLLLGAWVLNISVKVQHIYDQIDQANQETSALNAKVQKK